MSVTLPVAPQVKSLRCSSLDAVFGCTPSVLGDGVRISSDNDGATVGKIVHSMGEDYVTRGKFDLKNAVAAEGLDDSAEEEIAKLMIYLMKAWEEVKQYFPTPKTECIVKSDPLDVNGITYQIQGTCDVLSPLGACNAIFLDYKSGFLDDSYHHQMAGYAYSIWCVMGRPENTIITGIVIFLRHRYYRVVKFTADSLRQWEYDLIHNVLPSTGKFKVGKTCRYCELRHGCAARSAVVNGTLNAVMTPNACQPGDPYVAFMQRVGAMLDTLTPDQKSDPEVGQLVSEMLFRIKLAQQAIDDAHGLLRATVQRVSGIPLGNNLELALRKVEVQSLIPSKAMRVLRQHLSDSQIADAMRLSLPKLATAYAASFAKGEKAKSKNILYDALTSAGAIKTSIQERMEEIEISLPDPNQGVT